MARMHDIKTYVDDIRYELTHFESRLDLHDADPKIAMQAMDTLAVEFCRKLSLIAEECGGDRKEFRGAADGLRDCISEAMFRTIEAQDDEAEALNDPTEIAYAKGDAQRAEAR